MRCKCSLAVLLVLICSMHAFAQNVGIGLDTPSHKLTILSPDSNTLRLLGPGSFDSKARLTFGNPGNVFIEEDRDDHLAIYSKWRTGLLGGYVGVGTKSPGAPLHILGKYGGYTTIIENTDSIGDFAGAFALYKNNAENGFSLGINGTSHFDPETAFLDTPFDLKFNAGGEERMRISSDGKIGIGTATPAAHLEIQGADPDDGRFIQLSNSDRSQFVRLFSGRQHDTLPFLNWQDGSTFRFVTSNNDFSGFSERMVITGDGAVGIGTSIPDSSAVLEIESSTGGLLIPRLTTNDRIAIASPATGLILYDTDKNSFWFYNGVAWVDLSAESTMLVDADGDTKISAHDGPGTRDSIMFEIDGVKSLEIRRNNIGDVLIAPKSFYFNTALGDSALFSNDDFMGQANTAIGYRALKSNLSGNRNTAVGAWTLISNSDGFWNTAIGEAAMFYNTSGSRNTAVGVSALKANTSGEGNTATGLQALFSNTEGRFNTAVGMFALYKNTLGEDNTATGRNTLYENDSGSDNTASGRNALRFNISGSHNTANGRSAMYSNTSGSANVGIGVRALYNNTDRSHLVAVGDSALFNNGVGASLPFHSVNNTAIGSKALFSNTTGNTNTAMGKDALSSNNTGSFNTATGVAALLSNTSGTSNTANGLSALRSNTEGFSNTATGVSALVSNISGSGNTAHGTEALSFNITGNTNVAIGAQALYRNTDRSNLVAVGASALYNNGIGASSALHATRNTAVGDNAMFANTTGYENSATGSDALKANTTGIYNTATGTYALLANTIGSNNTAHGRGALAQNTDGYQNTANGTGALFFNTSGFQNTALGAQALHVNTGSSNTATGMNALVKNDDGIGNTATGVFAMDDNTSGGDNTAVGVFALNNNVSGSGNTAIGRSAFFTSTALNNTTCLGQFSGGISNVSNRVEIGNSSVSWIGGQVGWSTYSDARIKTQVKENVPGLDFIAQLRPVTYHLDIHKQNAMCARSRKEKVSNWPTKYDIEQKRMTGFIAQEVAQAAQAVDYDFSGVEMAVDDAGMYSIRYSEFVVPLVQAVQEMTALYESLTSQAGRQRVIVNLQQVQIQQLESRLTEMDELKKRIVKLESLIRNQKKVLHHD